jgi:hypothetical protein
MCFSKQIFGGNHECVHFLFQETTMLIKSKILADGPGPSEVVVEIVTANGGIEEVVVPKDRLKDGNLEVGQILGRRDGVALVQLPRESTTGRWRLWVPESQVMQIA